MGRSQLLWLFFPVVFVSFSSCARFFKQTGTVVSTRMEEVCGIDFDCAADPEGVQTRITRDQVQVTKYRNRLGLTWEESKVVSSEPFPGGWAAFEKEQLEKAQAESQDAVR